MTWMLGSTVDLLEILKWLAVLNIAWALLDDGEPPGYI